MMLLVATGSCWVTCTSFTMLALFHIKEVKISDYTAIQELITRDIKLKTLELNNYLNLYCGNLFAKMLARNKMSIIRMYSI